MLGFLKRQMEAADPETKQRVCELLQENGILFLEAAFRHVSSDYWILRTTDDVAELFEWFKGRGGRTPLYISSLEQTLATVVPIVEVSMSHPGWETSLGQVFKEHRLLLAVQTEGRLVTAYAVEFEEELPSLQLPQGAMLRAYRSWDVASKSKPRLTVWVGKKD